MEEKFYQQIGSLIRQERRSRDYSQEYMALKLGISQSAYHKIEMGKTLSSFYRLATVFHLLGIEKGRLLEYFPEASKHEHFFGAGE